MNYPLIRMNGSGGTALAAWLTLAGSALAQSGPPVPPHSVWWCDPPTRTSATRLLWHFGAADDAAALDDLLAPVTAPSLEVEAEPNRTPRLRGAAQVTPAGFFGDGLALGRDGAAEARPLALPVLASQFGQASVELFVRLDQWPDATATLLDFGGGLRLGWQDRQLTIHAADQELHRHPTQWTTGRWYHVAASWTAPNTVRLSVNGTPVTTKQRRLENTGRGLTIGPGLVATVDEVWVVTGPRHLYARLDDDWTDPSAARDLPDGPPYFASRHGVLTRDFNAPATAPGVRGGALVVTNQTVVLGPADALRAPQGSLEFWLQPGRWNNFYRGIAYDPDFPWRVLLQARDPQQPNRAVEVLAVGQGAGGRFFNPTTRLVPFHPGRWVHVVVAWGPHGGVYLNGERQEFEQVRLRRQVPTNGWDLVAAVSETVLDEFRLYPYALHPTEAANAYRRFFADGTLQPLPEIEAAFEYVAADWQVDAQRLSVTLRCLPVRNQVPRSATVVLRQPAGTALIGQATLALDEHGAAQTNFQQALAFATYPVEITSHAADGQVLTTRTLPFEWRQPEWYGNKLGRDRIVPPPWTPITGGADRQLTVWGRDLTVATTGLPAALRSLGRTVLAAPVRLHGVADGQPFAVRDGELQFTETAPDRVRWTATSPATPGLAAVVTAGLEYDGLLDYAVRFERLPAAKTSPVIERLWVDIPLAVAETSQLIANGGGFNFRASYDVRFIPAGTGSVWNSRTAKPQMQRGLESGSFLPQIWLGGDHVGLSISGVNDQGWTPDNAVPAQEVVRDGDQVIFRMNVITQPVPVETNRTFTFILLPTPSKPMPAKWRSWNRSPAGAPLTRYENVDDFDGYPLTSPPREAVPLTFKLEPHDWETAAHWSQAGRKKAGAQNPLLKYINYSWPALGPSVKPWLPAAFAGGRLSWTTETEDYYVWIVNEYLRRGLIDGIYIDDVSLGRTFRVDAGAYDWFNPETGKTERRVGFNSLGFRRFLQRIYHLTVAQGKPPRLCPHMTWCFELPALSFCDAVLNGEDRDIYAFDKRDSIATWSRAELRVMGPSPKWGFVQFWKWTIGVDPPGRAPTPKPKDRVAAWLYSQRRAADAWIPQHDLWYFWGDSGLRPVLSEFGMDAPDLEFIPYWEAAHYFEVTGADPNLVIVGCWRRGDRALVLVSNLTDAAVTVTVTPRLAKLWGGANGPARWRDVDPVPIPPPPPVEKSLLAAQDLAADLFTARESTEQNFLDNLAQQLEPREEQEIKRLAPRVAGDSLTLLVRPRDYRLLVLERP